MQNTPCQCCFTSNHAAGAGTGNRADGWILLFVCMIAQLYDSAINDNYDHLLTYDRTKLLPHQNKITITRPDAALHSVRSGQHAPAQAHISRAHAIQTTPVDHT